MLVPTQLCGPLPRSYEQKHNEVSFQIKLKDIFKVMNQDLFTG